MTVRGPVDPDDLGLTLPHEHVFIDLVREYRADGLLNDRSLAVAELRAYADAGGRTLVDCTSIGLARDPLALVSVARETGLHIVMGCGYYRDPYLPAELDTMSVDSVADSIVRDIEEGADGTGVRAGVIGEIGSDRGHLSALEERSFRAAARAHHRTGLTITTHAARWPVGLPQLDLLAEERVDPRRVVVGHCDLVPDPAYHLAVARRGAFVQLDTVQGESEYDTQCRVAWVRNLAEHG
ncbi:MAG: phosphotriesterase family protein, partial [Nocardioidaceae bacterium]